MKSKQYYSIVLVIIASFIGYIILYHNNKLTVIIKPYTQQQIYRLLSSEKKIDVTPRVKAMHNKPFVYLINCKQCISDEHIKQDVLGSGERYDVIVLSYFLPCNDTRYHRKFITYLSPPGKTTWTSGRNILYR